MWFYESLYPDIKIGIKGNCLYEKKTRYQNMKIYSTARFGRMLTLDGAIQTTEKDEFIYHEMLTHPVLLIHPNPKKVLVIGGGDGGAVREILKHRVEKVYLVEIDKEVVDISKRYLKKICGNAFSDKRVKLIVDDGARFIQKTKEKFDIVIVDSPDPIGPAKILFSKKFYTNIYSVLNSKGIMIRQSGSTVLQKEELRTNYKILSKIFPYVSVQIAAIPTYIGGFFSLLAASKSINLYDFDIEKVEKKIKKIKLTTNYYNSHIHMGSLLLPTYIRRLIS